MINSNKRLILIELNEINFDIVSQYIATDNSRFPSFRKLLAGPTVRTIGEGPYEQLEPWIQWVSVHTGKTYADHGVFRLGDIVGSSVPQIFERLEESGLRVGAVSAMNAENRLNHPAYFVPDPWTQTPSDSSFWSRALGQAVSQAVNDNAQARITAKSALQLILSLLRFARARHYRKYLSLAAASQRKPWLKALVLDLLLHDVHWTMFGTKKPNFSTLFLNAGAHIQHHYFFNAAPLRNVLNQKNPEWYVPAEADPLADVLNLYDLIVGEYLARTDTDVVLATGLTQKPYDKAKFYYRLNSHEAFLRDLDIQFTTVVPRMTRDFLVEFENEKLARIAQKLLENIRVEETNLPLFGEIDNRGKSLFVTLTYPQEITGSTCFHIGNRIFPLLPKVSFVAIKNGMHQSEGFAFFTSNIAKFAPVDGAHVSNLGNTVLNYFGVDNL
jgi:hypothetical protein